MHIRHRLLSIHTVGPRSQPVILYSQSISFFFIRLAEPTFSQFTVTGRPVVPYRDLRAFYPFPQHISIAPFVLPAVSVVNRMSKKKQKKLERKAGNRHAVARKSPCKPTLAFSPPFCILLIHFFDHQLQSSTFTVEQSTKPGNLSSCLAVLYRLTSCLSILSPPYSCLTVQIWSSHLNVHLALNLFSLLQSSAFKHS